MYTILFYNKFICTFQEPSKCCMSEVFTPANTDQRIREMGSTQDTEIYVGLGMWYPMSSVFVYSIIRVVDCSYVLECQEWIPIEGP